MRKYELTKETKTLADGMVLHRVRALMDISRYGVKAGDLGGWIEKYDNLSQDGDAWVYGDAKIFDNANVFDNAKVSGDATVYGDAWVYGNAWVSGDATVYGDACVSGNAYVLDNARVYGDACVSGNAMVFGDADVYGDAWVSGNTKVYGNACVLGDDQVSGDARVFGNALVSGKTDYMTFKNSWSSGRWFTYTRSNRMWKVGCFHGTGEELIEKAYADSELSGKCYEAIVRAVETIEAAKAKAKGESNGRK